MKKAILLVAVAFMFVVSANVPAPSMVEITYTRTPAIPANTTPCR